MQTILLWFFLINGLYIFRTFTCPSSGVLIHRLFHCRMWCYVIGVEAVVLRSWCVVLCTVCQLEAIYEKKIIVKLFASRWYIFLTYIYDARSHLHQISLQSSEKYSKYHISQKSVQWEPRCPCGRTEMTKIMVGFRNFAKAPKIAQELIYNLYKWNLCLNRLRTNYFYSHR